MKFWPIACAAVLSLLPVLVGRAAAQSDLSEQKSLVVMLHSIDKAGQFEPTVCAAAIVLSTRNGHTLLLTANHVLDKMARENADRAKAKAPPVELGAAFFGSNGTFYRVSLKPGLADVDLDYAVVEVVMQDKIPNATPRSWKVIGSLENRASDAADGSAYKDVRAIGYAGCQSWETSVSLEKVKGLNARGRVQFESRFVKTGTSGGGLFAEDGSLVGMVTDTDGSFGYAAPLDAILADLREKGLEFDLSYIAGQARGRFDVSSLPEQYRTVVGDAQKMKITAAAKANEATAMYVAAEFFAKKAKAVVRGQANLGVGSMKIDENSTYYGQIIKKAEGLQYPGYGMIETVGGPRDGAAIFCRFTNEFKCMKDIGYYETAKSYWFGWAGELTGDIVKNTVFGAGQTFGTAGDRIWLDYSSNSRVGVIEFADGSIYQGEYSSGQNGRGVLWKPDGQVWQLGTWVNGRLDKDETARVR